MRITLLVFLSLLFTHSSKAQILHFFNPPLTGVEGKDYFIVNYVDHDTTSGIKDYHCLDKTYDGHQGTDFVLRSFKTMDSGVYVHAVASGRVFFTKDSLFDRNKHTNNGGFGNYIGINHQNQIYTYYAHLMKYSLLVHVGDSVTAGQIIAKVACSGNCTDPHLHLEVYNNTSLVDPFNGPCQTATPTLWNNQPYYDTSLLVIDNGFTPYVPNLDTLRERYNVKDTFKVNDTVNFWCQMQGLRAGDTERVDWYTPANVLWFSYAYRQNTDGWYNYFWTYIIPSTQGLWSAKYYVKNNLTITSTFYVNHPAAISNISYPNDDWSANPNPFSSTLFITGSPLSNQPFLITDITGKILKSFPSNTKILQLTELPKGLYFLKHSNSIKKIVKE